MLDNPLARLLQPSDQVPLIQDSIESLKLKLEAMSEEMSILMQLQEKEIAVLQEANARALEALRAKDQEISALQSTAAFLMKENRSLGQKARSASIMPGQEALPTQGGNRSIRTHFQQLSQMREDKYTEIWIPNDKDHGSEHE